MKLNEQLKRVISAGNETRERLMIPADMISLHSDLRNAILPEGKTLQGRRQHTLRWGAFLLVYAPVEGFFKEILEVPAGQRGVPLNSDKIREKAMKDHGVRLFTKDWGVRTLVPTKTIDDSNFCEWRVYRGVEEVRTYLADMKSLRDLLSHGADPFTAKNDSGALWSINRGPSLRMLGVNGFLQAGCDLVDQTITAFGGTSEQFPAWPKYTRADLPTPMPSLTLSQH